MKVPSTNWLPVSLRKLRSRRGPNCDEVSDSTAMVMAKVVPATPRIDEAMASSTERAPSGPPP